MLVSRDGMMSAERSVEKWSSATRIVTNIADEIGHGFWK
jgi:hypothetical protein